jgi:hypothetical protein
MDIEMYYGQCLIWQRVFIQEKGDGSVLYFSLTCPDLYPLSKLTGINTDNAQIDSRLLGSSFCGNRLNLFSLIANIGKERNK